MRMIIITSVRGFPLFPASRRPLFGALRCRLATILGDASTVPHWRGSGFDSIYVVRIERREGRIGASFALERRQLNGQAAACPAPVPAAKP